MTDTTEASNIEAVQQDPFVAGMLFADRLRDFKDDLNGLAHGAGVQCDSVARLAVTLRYVVHALEERADWDLLDRAARVHDRWHERRTEAADEHL